VVLRPVPHQRAADGVVGAVDGDVEGAQPLLDDPLEVALAEVRDGDVVAVEEREAEVAVAEVERLAEAEGALVDEAEDAVVPARLDAELLELDAEALVVVLRDVLDFELPLKAHLQLQLLLGGLEAEVELVLDGLAVDGDDLVARPPAERLGERALFDGGDLDGHERVRSGGEPAKVGPSGAPSAPPVHRSRGIRALGLRSPRRLPYLARPPRP